MTEALGVIHRHLDVFTAVVIHSFPDGVGKTSSPETFNSLLDDVQTQLFDVLPDDTWFYPGHGDDSTLGEQKPHLDEWRERGW